LDRAPGPAGASGSPAAGGPAGRRIAIRVDVDTHTGLRDGVPLLLERLGRLGVRASFFVTMGPDNSGRAIGRLFTRKGFARKMARTNALRTYGLRTILSGTLLPSRPVGSGFPEILRRIEANGHECGIHGWDHVLWHDRIERMGEPELFGELTQAEAAFAEATGHHPAGTAAPAWRATEASLEAQDRLPFLYASDTRGTTPFFVARADGAPHRLLQIPATLSTLDEILGAPGMTPERIVETLASELGPDRLNVFTIHTEVEGRHHAALFETILRRFMSDGWSFETLGEIAARVTATSVGAPPPLCRLDRAELPGRPGWVSIQAAI
jgi:undecaprenyl phosphate-alpha-L-ara4FN deformylase